MTPRALGRVSLAIEYTTSHKPLPQYETATGTGVEKKRGGVGASQYSEGQTAAEQAHCPPAAETQGPSTRFGLHSCTAVKAVRRVPEGPAAEVGQPLLGTPTS